MKILSTLVVMLISVTVHAQKDTMHITYTDTTTGTTKEFEMYKQRLNFPEVLKGGKDILKQILIPIWVQNT